MLPCWITIKRVMVCRIVNSEKTVIPAWSGKMVSVRLTDQVYLAEAGYIQPNPDVSIPKQLLVIPDIVSTRVHVRMANSGDQDAVLYSMTDTATCRSIDMNDVPTEGNFEVYTLSMEPLKKLKNNLVISSRLT